MRFGAKLGHTHLNPNLKESVCIMDLIPITGSTKLEKKRLKNPSPSFNSKDIRKIKGFQKPSSKKLYFTLRSNNTKYIKHFTLSLFHDQTLTEEHHNLTADILGKILY